MGGGRDARGCPGRLRGFLPAPHRSSHLHTPTVPSPLFRPQGGAGENKPARGESPREGGARRGTASARGREGGVRGLAALYPTPTSWPPGPALPAHQPFCCAPDWNCLFLEAALLLPDLVHGAAGLPRHNPASLTQPENPLLRGSKLATATSWSRGQSFRRELSLWSAMGPPVRQEVPWQGVGGCWDMCSSV